MKAWAFAAFFAVWGVGQSEEASEASKTKPMVPIITMTNEPAPEKKDDAHEESPPAPTEEPEAAPPSEPASEPTVKPAPEPDLEPALKPTPVPATVAAPTSPILRVTPRPKDDRLLTLREACDEALTNNIDLRIARERLASASILSRKAWAVILPTISFRMGGTYFDKRIQIPFGLPEDLRPLFAQLNITFPEPEIVTLQNQTQLSASLSFNWILFNGRAVPLLMNAYAFVEAAELGFKQFEEMLITATTLAYYNALSVQRQVELRQRALDTAHEHLRMARARVEVGIAFEVEATRSEVEVATEEQALAQLRNGERLAKLALSMLMGGRGARHMMPTFVVTRPPTPRIDETGKSLLDRAYDQRLDLKQNQIKATIASRLHSETWLRFLPMVVGSGIYSWSDVEGFSGDHVNWNMMLNLQWNVFDGGIHFWELQERKHDLKAASLLVEKTRQDIARQIREARANLESAEANYVLALKRVGLARQTADMIRSQYEVGVSTQLDLLDAERTLADSETGETLARLQVDVAQVSLVRVVKAPPRLGL